VPSSCHRRAGRWCCRPKQNAAPADVIAQVWSSPVVSCATFGQRDRGRRRDRRDAARRAELPIVVVAPAVRNAADQRTRVIAAGVDRAGRPRQHHARGRTRPRGSRWRSGRSRPRPPSTPTVPSARIAQVCWRPAVTRRERPRRRGQRQLQHAGPCRCRARRPSRCPSNASVWSSSSAQVNAWPLVSAVTPASVDAGAGVVRRRRGVVADLGRCRWPPSRCSCRRQAPRSCARSRARCRSRSASGSAWGPVRDQASRRRADRDRSAPSNHTLPVAAQRNRCGRCPRRSP